MYWPDRGSGVPVEPDRKPVLSAVRQFFTEGGPGVPPTVPGGDWFNQITNELLNVLAAAGIEPNKVDDSQLEAAIRFLCEEASETLKSRLASNSGSSIIGDFDTAIELQASDEPVKFSRVKTLGYHQKNDGGGCDYEINDSPEFGSVTLANGLFANPINLSSPRQIGWTDIGGEDNYNKISAFVQSGNCAPKRYKTLLTMHRIYAEWLAGRGCPLAFFGDSTTDGATTTGHVPSTPNGNTWGSSVTINQSPNSYPKVLDSWCKKNAPAAKIYNAGFDSTSLREGVSMYDGFGNKFFHRVFFGYPDYNNVDFSDVKAIALSYGTSDSINLNDVNTIIDSYEWKMELLIVECFERGIQPIINHPVLNTQRRGSLVNGRDNDESVTIIQSINERLSKKYNLEIISLHDALYHYVNDNDDRTGDYLNVLAVDGVHPNDMGHRQIAGYFYSKLNPLVKTVTDGERFSASAGNPYVYTAPSLNGVDIWKEYDHAILKADQSFYHRFTPSVSNEFFNRFYVYCEKPMDLIYSGLMDANYIVTDFNKLPQVYVKHVAGDVTFKCALWSDYQGVLTSLTSISAQVIARLGVGLNEIQVQGPPTLGLRSFFDFGTLMVVPRSTEGVAREYFDGSSPKELRLDLLSSFPDIFYGLTAASNDIWCHSKFERNAYYAGRIGTDTQILFKANSLDQRSLYWAANRRFEDFDSKNQVTFSGTSVELSVIAPNSSGVPVKTVIATMTSSYNFSTVDPDSTFSLLIQHLVDGSLVFWVRRLNKSTGVFDNLCSTTMSSVSNTRIFSAGYSFGAKKTASGSQYMYLAGISVQSHT
ncbi:SGNH/GDSL hydrolase family protein [Aeromonas molluscorum]|uniref:SGNH/GDSL hydrolase family protein n=1 Tax=Aeromonas molluscorum TaxID=271417 RepID=UPI003F19FFBA